MELQPGDVIYVYCLYSKPQKYKYAICVCPEPPLFFFINTHPRQTSPNAQVYVTTAELPCLKGDSNINTALMVTFQPNELKKAEKKGELLKVLKERIVQAVSNHGHLPPRHKQIVLENFRT